MTTPRNQHHEIGAIIVSTVAAMHAWNVTYLGPNLPSDEIVGAAKLSAAKAIGLSIVYPSDDPDLSDELRRLRAGVGQGLPIIVGGRGAQGYAAALMEIGAEPCDSFGVFKILLDRIRSSEAVGRG